MKKRTINPEEKMAKVIVTARRLFVDNGYCGVSIPDIVKASGVSTGAIYSYFKDKESLAKHIHEQTIGEFDTLFRDRLSGTESVYEVLEIFTKLVCELTETEPILMKYMLFMNHGGVVNDLLPICSTEPFRLLQSHLRRGIDSGEIRVEDYLIAGLSYTGITIRAAELRFDGVLTQPLTEISATLVENGWNAIKA
ncbi:MAG: TetR/AcrR family transcriptional regulator [Deltaproteobacteria bacterium]|nr:TetR/AcrR family transcriptional regulator [Deltaproteobacteria bacterium]